jgi:translation initiation factor 4E
MYKCVAITKIHSYYGLQKDEKKENQVAVVDPESPIKHPLQNSWGLWYFKNDRNTRDWALNLKLVATVSTVEDFWA